MLFHLARLEPHMRLTTHTHTHTLYLVKDYKIFMQKFNLNLKNIISSLSFFFVMFDLHIGINSKHKESNLYYYFWNNVINEKI